ncbi:ABC transporter ATP-binding protein [Flavihumibacter fluvii]|uniref:ABC transporter ATP-binding protein n=1 Tax=Flavihumibacter fluvii TaxID=2838157 RepID=UPI001BDF5B02|nr:ABC transporter ATP-binding protein [Flavihumibacter fluvii]ULQ52505.1 ABC transporter ATP-binding protein/permease [Flavihumibacter fluvii]
MSSSTAPKKIFDFSLLNRVFSLAKPYRKKVIGSLVLAILLAVLSPVRPYLIQITVNEYIRNGLLDWVVRITLIQVVFLVIETIFRFLFTFITSWIGQTVVKDLRVSVFNKVIHLNLSQFDKTPIGTLTTRTINDIESINDIFSDGLIPIIADLLSIVSILFVMFWVDWKLALISLAPFPILIIATYLFKESVNRSFIKVRNAVAALNAFVQEHLTGMQVVQAFAAEGREHRKFRAINKDHRNANIKAIFAYSVFFPVVEIVLAVSTGLLVWWGATRAMLLPEAEAAAMAGKMIAFILYLNLLFRPLRFIADKFNVLQMGMVASERVFKLMDNADFIQLEGSFSPAKVKGRIEFDHVWFGYNDHQYVLKDLNFVVEPGETIALVGHTGSGKTSIISLLNRLYHINKGQIRIDGVSLEEFKLDALRRQTGVVLQDVFLFSGSVLDNITLRNPEISRKQVERAAQLIGMHQFIEQLPGGYDYNVMERGSTLSLGQRQLLSFIRALLYDPSILILDEATSSVDTESEQLIQHAIEALISGRTAIVIAHRLSTIRRADKIIVLEKGEIREIGNHEDLMEREGYYYSLYQSQFEEAGKGER